MTDQDLCQLVRNFTDNFETTCMGYLGVGKYPEKDHPGNDPNLVRDIRVKDLYEFARQIKREAEGGSTDQ